VKSESEKIREKDAERARQGMEKGREQEEATKV
jgi:hypothetical protein